MAVHFMRKDLPDLEEPDSWENSFKNKLVLQSIHSQIFSEDPLELCLASAHFNVEQIFSIPAYLLLCPVQEKLFQVNLCMARISSLQKKVITKIGMGTKQGEDLQSNLMKLSLKKKISNPRQ